MGISFNQDQKIRIIDSGILSLTASGNPQVITTLYPENTPAPAKKNFRILFMCNSEGTNTYNFWISNDGVIPLMSTSPTDQMSYNSIEIWTGPATSSPLNMFTYEIQAGSIVTPNVAHIDNTGLYFGVTGVAADTLNIEYLIYEVG